MSAGGYLTNESQSEAVLWVTTRRSYVAIGGTFILVMPFAFISIGLLSTIGFLFALFTAVVFSFAVHRDLKYIHSQQNNWKPRWSLYVIMSI